MTNIEFLKTASIENIARFLLTCREDEPQDWPLEMQECVNWLNEKFDDNSF